MVHPAMRERLFVATHYDRIVRMRLFVRYDPYSKYVHGGLACGRLTFRDGR